MYSHTKKVITGTTPLAEATHALIMLHGRGASAESILDLANHLNLKQTAISAPQASNNSWYPYSFMVATEQNQPALNSALNMISSLVDDIVNFGIPAKNIFLAGFSQGACLALEFAARNAEAYGGIVAFTGGLIGDELDLSNYKGDFKNTPILITTGNPDPHVPLSRVEESVSVLKNLHAHVTLKIFKGRAHTILKGEIELANQLIFK